MLAGAALAALGAAPAWAFDATGYRAWLDATLAEATALLAEPVRRLVQQIHDRADLVHSCQTNFDWNRIASHE